jgi:hypothetical protein
MSNFKKLDKSVQVKLLEDALNMLSDALAHSGPPGPLTKVEVNGVALVIVLAAMDGADLVEGAERASKYFESDGRSVE